MATIMKLHRHAIINALAFLIFALTATTIPAQTTTSQLPLYAFAPTPPMGWNSYDAFGDTVTEDEVMANANYVKENLLPHGWNYIVIDFRWYDPEPTGNDHLLNQLRTGAKLPADAFGRLLPAENRFPSSAGGKGFKPLADTASQNGTQVRHPLYARNSTRGGESQNSHRRFPIHRRRRRRPQPTGRMVSGHVWRSQQCRRSGVV